jgi:hypothetical protein
MRQVLINEVCKERPNAQALGAFNHAVFVGASYNTKRAVDEIKGFLYSESLGKDGGRSLDSVAKLTGTNRDYAIGLVNDYEDKGRTRQTYDHIAKLARAQVKKEASEKGYVQFAFKTMRTRKNK